MIATTFNHAAFRVAVALVLMFSSSLSGAQTAAVSPDSLPLLATKDILTNATLLSQKIIGAEHRARALNNIAVKLSMSNQTAKAQTTWNEALWEANRLTNVKLKSATTRELIEGALNIGLTDTARYLAFRLDMENDKVLALHSVADALLESGKTEKVDDIIKALSTAQEELENTAAKASAFARLSLLLFKTNNKPQAETALNVALAVATTVEDLNERTTLLGNCAADFFSAQQAASARKILAEAQRAISQIKERNLQSSAKAMLVSSLIKANEIDAARSLALSISDPLERAVAASRVAPELAKLKQPEASKQLFAEARRAGASLRIVADRAEALGRIVIELARAGFADDAKAVANEAILFANNIRTPFDKSTAFSELSIDFAEAGLFDKSEAAIARVAIPSRQIEALCALATALLQSGAIQKATPFFADALAKIDSIETIENRASNLYRLADAGFQTNLSPLADSAFARAALVAPLISGQKKQLEQMQNAAVSFAKGRRIDKALETVEKMNDAFTQVRTLTEIAEIQRAQNLALGDAEKTVLKRLIDFLR